MSKSIIFASHIPTKGRLFVGQNILDKFVKDFSDYVIYVGVNNSCEEWYTLLDEYSAKLDIQYETTPTELLDTSGGAAYQTALRMLHNSGNKHDIYWFVHTKGATSGSEKFIEELGTTFWGKKDVIEPLILSGEYSIFSPYITLTGPNYINTTLPVFIDGHENNDLASLYSFWVLSGEVINTFILNCDKRFFTQNLLTFNDTIDRYFFERDFPMIYQKMDYSKKLLYVYIDDSHRRFLQNKTIEELTKNNIKQI
jgi:hypothetical protein